MSWKEDNKKNFILSKSALSLKILSSCGVFPFSNFLYRDFCRFLLFAVGQQLCLSRGLVYCPRPGAGDSGGVFTARSGGRFRSGRGTGIYLLGQCFARLLTPGQL